MPAYVYSFDTVYSARAVYTLSRRTVYTRAISLFLSPPCPACPFYRGIIVCMDWDWLLSWSPVIVVFIAVASLVATIIIGVFVIGINTRVKEAEERKSDLDTIAVWIDEVYDSLFSFNIGGFVNVDIPEKNRTLVLAELTKMSIGLTTNWRKAVFLHAKTKNKWPELASLINEWTNKARPLSTTLDTVRSDINNLDVTLLNDVAMHYRKTAAPALELSEKTQDIYDELVKKTKEDMSEE